MSRGGRLGQVRKREIVVVKRRTRGKGESTNEVDAQVGQRLRELRMLAGLSQSDLAATIGLTFQQLQKYERGVNRISASKLYLLARHLNIPVSTFFADLEGQQGDSQVPEMGADSIQATNPNTGEVPVRSREALILARNFQRIRDPEAKEALKAFIEICAGMTVSEDAQNHTTKSPRSFGRSSSDAASDGGGRRSRRPRGVIWHPTDITK